MCNMSRVPCYTTPKEPAPNTDDVRFPMRGMLHVPYGYVMV